jgi:guanylate kinase
MDEFEKMIGEEGFVEHAKFGGNRYGTSKKMIKEKEGEGRTVVLDIEMEVCLSFAFPPVSLCAAYLKFNNWRRTRPKANPYLGRQTNPRLLHIRPLRLHRTTINGSP